MFPAKLVTLLFIVTIPLLSEELNMLFIGNSFTMRHELPSIVKALLEEGDPASTITTEIVGLGGKSLFHHWDIFHNYNRLMAATLSPEQWEMESTRLKELGTRETAPNDYTEYFEAMGKSSFWKKNNPNLKPNWAGETNTASFASFMQMGWRKNNKQGKEFDYLVLKSWQDVTESADSGYLKYVQKFASLGAKLGAKPVLYLTAPNSHNAEPVTNGVGKAEAIGTCRIMFESFKNLNALVVPVPLALILVQESPEPVARTITTRYKKDFHPNNTMAYLSACTFYAAITGKSPEGLRFNKVSENKLQDIHGQPLNAGNKNEAISKAFNPDGGPLDTVFDDETRLFLQRIAWKAVEQFNRGDF